MHQRGEEFWNGPAAVVVEYTDGGRDTVTFDKRVEAEQWLGLLPWRQAAGDADVAGIVAAQMAETWTRNLEVLATLATVHRCWQGPDVKVGGLIREMEPFLRTAFEMGRAAAEGE